MTQLVLSAATQAAINLALGSDGLGNPGQNNVNYIAAYNDIYSDLAANGNINVATLAWFEQAPLVNGEKWNPSAQGTFIWDYTAAAALAQGATITSDDLQTSSNTIALTVFKTLSKNNFVFDDSSGPNSFSIHNIVAVDAGAGLQVIKDAHPTAHLDNAIWGGTLFATTELQDATYFQDFNIQLGLGTRDSAAILAGFFAGSAGVLAAGLQPQWNALVNAHFIDIKALTAAALPTSQYLKLPSFSSSASWTFGAVTAPTALSDQVGAGNLEIYDAALGEAITINGADGGSGTAVIYSPNVGKQVIQYADNSGDLISTNQTYDLANTLVSTSFNFTDRSPITVAATVEDATYDVATNTFTGALTYNDPIDVGSLTINSSGAGHVTLADGFQIPVSTNGSINLSAPADGSTAEAALLSYLNDLGVAWNAAQLNETHDEFLHPTGAAYTVNPSVVVPNSSTTAQVFYDLSPYGNSAAGAVIAGQATVQATVNNVLTTLQADNILRATGDLSQDNRAGSANSDSSLSGFSA
ncbi:hypothetical protein NLM33_46645 [Bradyrhizobium sp. CCGUVB1N3]|uniref:hypothetical protein n=1 Tax=Bradyrhizobium sp. CCGUVB1N3 TaxID=2949629 RepID=UPI0020B2DD6C|nr:hypothetical protein [Bradyrhizobium sp. CCGUVB1N3]MCP3477638.1 hypothetical protein [Bradyrhizobium sp. CCGUVB1N3]